jgi:hypothetical protein
MVVMDSTGRYRLVRVEPADNIASSNPHSVQAGVLLHPAARFSARPLRYFHVPDHSRSALTTQYRAPDQCGANSLRTTPMRSEVRTPSSATAAIDNSTSPKVKARFPL